jgi:hypothetical protein
MQQINYLNLLHIALIELLAKYKSNPYYYFYEEDIRVDLAQLLINKFDNIEVQHFNQKITTTPVKCEYPSSLANNDRHDPPCLY